MTQPAAGLDAPGAGPGDGVVNGKSAQVQAATAMAEQRTGYKRSLPWRLVPEYPGVIAQTCYISIVNAELPLLLGIGGKQCLLFPTSRTPRFLVIKIAYLLVKVRFS